MRREDIDVYKGVLVWLVVISHIMAISVKMSNLILFKIIVNSHIPLFLGISGFLFKTEKFNVKNILHRLIFPWAISNVIYLILPGSSFSLVGLILGFETHLWYVPSLILFMTLIWFIEKNKFPKIMFGLGIIIAFFLQFKNLLIGENIIIKLFRFIVSNFRLQFLIFFLMGYLIKRIKLNCRKCLILEIGLISLLGGTITLGNTQQCFKFIGNIAIMFVLLKDEILISKQNNFISFLKLSGRNSMFIYLYHVIPLTLPFSNKMRGVLMIFWSIIMSIMLYKKTNDKISYLIGMG